MTGTTIIVGLGVAGLIAFIIIRLRGNQQSDASSSPPEIASESAIQAAADIAKTMTAKAESAVGDTHAQEQAQDLHEGLSQSGAVTIGAEVKRCMDTEKWDEAIKWLLHAMDALPDRTDFKVTLAEVYVMIEDRESFTELFEKLYVDIADHAEDKERLMIAARAFIPEHTVIQAEATAPEKQYALRSRSLRPTLAAI
jgi:hypothetical protein